MENLENQARIRELIDIWVVLRDMGDWSRLKDIWDRGGLTPAGTIVGVGTLTMHLV